MARALKQSLDTKSQLSKSEKGEESKGKQDKKVLPKNLSTSRGSPTIND